MATIITRAGMKHVFDGGQCDRQERGGDSLPSLMCGGKAKCERRRRGGRPGNPDSCLRLTTSCGVAGRLALSFRLRSAALQPQSKPNALPASAHSRHSSPSRMSISSPTVYLTLSHPTPGPQLGRFTMSSCSPCTNSGWATLGSPLRIAYRRVGLDIELETHHRVGYILALTCEMLVFM